MNWFTDWLFGNKTLKQTTLAAKEDPQSRYLKEALKFTKQQHKELSQQQAELRRKQQEQERRQRDYAGLHVDQLKSFTGVEFENYLVELFKQQGFQVETTPVTGDYGADLILHKEGQRIAVQAKYYSGSVGVSAVQQALSGMVYYGCQTAWVVTTGNFTVNAIELARQSRVRLIGRNELGQLIVEMQTNTDNLKR
jgi:HJR/Mrr/RecB family endonuclease